MATINSKSLRNTIKQFVKSYGREPSFEELRQLMLGKKVETK
jgi:hypothetical protein